ncbi:PREDICTED: protein FAR1-RELATED SEQUENCE 2-like [Ipomoea nil]|uniref:protein FAR1-RELATED SEQUENCE 2-like n=1 Tax=Ipomoea nil TaxID=35883 RepID=UPI000901FC9C|nr:PREDICTED: protein FAR1-RELATED SEQUENCE 2-like [Ipomoea nil]
MEDDAGGQNCVMDVSPSDNENWLTGCGSTIKPAKGQLFNNLEDGIEFYKKYASKAGFDVRRSSDKKNKHGVILRKKMVCSREGFKETKNTGPSVSDPSTKARRHRPSTRVGCVARIVFKRDSAGRYVVKTFEEAHTHCLCEESYKPFLKVNRKLDVGHQQFITNCSKVNIGASKSIDIYAEMVGGVENVGYSLVFVPFTGVDNHKKCVTFAAALIAREDVDLYCWALRIFKSAMGSTPRITATNQDPTMKVAIAKEFPETRHRYCMWNIMTKVSDKVSTEMARNEEFRWELNGVVWNDSATSEYFEVGWKGVNEKYSLQENAWLKRLAQGDISKLQPIRKTLEEFKATWCESGVERGATDKGKRVIMESYYGVPQPEEVTVHPPSTRFKQQRVGKTNEDC